MAFRPVLLTFFPLIRHSLISYHSEMTTIEGGDTKVRSSDLGTSLSSSNEFVDKDFEIVVSRPLSSSKTSSSLSSIPFHALFGSSFLGKKNLKSIRKRFQLLCGVVIRLPHSNEKACAFAHGEVNFYKAAF